MNYKIIGCGITGAVIARKLAEKGSTVTIYERRNHIAGNIYDYNDEHGYLVQQYGPHIFHTNDDEVIKFVKKYEDWNEFKLVCGAAWDGKYSPTPFNFTTIDTFYTVDEAENIKNHIKAAYPTQSTATIVELLGHDDPLIRSFANFLFENDYAPYTAKQWGIDPKEISPSVLKRVPVRLSYDMGYFSDKFEAMPNNSFTKFIENLINHPNIKVELNFEALDHITIENNSIKWDNDLTKDIFIYTGVLDELFGSCFGNLPYRSLRFEWKYEDTYSLQDAPVVAYPKEKGYTRITEFKKLPIQDGKGTSYAIEYPIPYKEGEKMEPYYPVPTEDSLKQYQKYRDFADQIDNLVCCGRLADFRYYNMDQAIKNALEISQML